MAKKKKQPMPQYLPSDEEFKWYLDGVRRGIRIAPKPDGNEWRIDVYANKKWNQSKLTYDREQIWPEYYKAYGYYYNRR